MSGEQIQFKILFRHPEYPVIVISVNELFSAFNFEELAATCISSKLSAGEEFIKMIDSTGEEFWYYPEQYMISPGFAFKNWTKKQIIELYNGSSTAAASDKQYSLKSLSNKKLKRIIEDICDLLK